MPMRNFLKLARQPGWERMTDEELAAHYRRNQAEGAANELFRRYVHLVYGASRRHLQPGTEEDWRDVVMLTFEQLYAHLRQEEVASSLNALLYTINRNVCFSQARRAARQGAQEEKWLIYKKSASGFMENDHFERLYNRMPREVVADLLGQALDQLDEAQRICLRLFFFEEKSYREVAAATGYDLKQVKSALQNGKRSLGIALDRVLKEIEK
jgi:RNA polymerase sigma-70 factor (ECF subfamily)